MSESFLKIENLGVLELTLWKEVIGFVPHHIAYVIMTRKRDWYYGTHVKERNRQRVTKMDIWKV